MEDCFSIVKAEFEKSKYTFFYQERGKRHYELTNHLGNVLTVISDKRILVCNADTVSYSYASIISATDYSPGGSPLPGRNLNSNQYSRGYNGQEKVDEISGSGNHTTAEFWEYDPRTGKRWNTDPVVEPSESPYATNRNNPIANSDPDGDCPDCPKPEIKAGVSLNFGSHNRSLGFNFSVTQNIGNLTLSGGLGITAFNKFSNTGKTGVELRGSFLGGFDNGKTSVTLGTNIFRGLGGMSEFSQRTGILNIGVGKFSASYENDGYPFNLGASKKGAPWLADGKDRYRTAAVRLGFGEFSAGFNLLTGSRTSFEGDEDKVGKMDIGDFGEKMPNDYVLEDGPKYRMGVAYVGYGRTKLGIDSDRWIRHPIQDSWAHNMKHPNTQQPGFKSLSNKISPYYQFNMNTQSSTKRFTLYE